MNDPSSSSSLPDLVAHLAGSVVGLGTGRHGGCGVVWRDGVVVTSATVAWRASRVSVVLPDGEQLPGEVRGFDGGTDLAAVTFNGGSIPAAERVSPVDVRVGDFVFAVARDGSGLMQASFGHVGSTSGEWRSWRGGRIDRRIRLDGGLYPGFSGAAVADASGRVIGVASNALSRHHGVVLPAATVDRVLDQLLAHGRVRQGYLGIAVQPVRAMLDAVAVDGLLVSSLADEGPAARAGLMVGDVIVKIDGKAAASLDALRDLLKVGAQVRVLVSRGGAAHEISIEVAQRPTSRCG